MKGRLCIRRRRAYRPSIGTVHIVEKAYANPSLSGGDCQSSRSSERTGYSLTYELCSHPQHHEQHCHHAPYHRPRDSQLVVWQWLGHDTFAKIFSISEVVKARIVCVRILPSASAANSTLAAISSSGASKMHT